MNLILISISALLAMWTFEFWHVVRERELRHELFTIQDELRWIAIGDAKFRNSVAFHNFDTSIRRCAANLDCFSIWTLLPVIMSSKAGPDSSYRKYVQQLTASPAVAALYDRYGQVFVDHLRSRHLCIWTICRIASFARPAWSLKERFLAAVMTTDAPRREMISDRHSIPV